MFLKEIKLTNFRNHLNFDMQFTEGATVIMGPNAVGKTNILEAIYYLATGRSFKAEYDRDVINHNAEFARVEGKVVEKNDEISLEITMQKNPNFENATIKKVKVNKVAKTLQSFAGYFNAVLFSPEDMDVLIGSPSLRRKFLDNILYQVDPKYKRIHMEYIQAVKQRNKILEKIRDYGRGTDELGFWNTKIVQNGVFVLESRDNLINYLSRKVTKYGMDLNDMSTDLEIRYLKSEISYERLHEYQNREIAAKSTLVGPHRDDFEVYLNDFNIAEFGSRGQQRSAMLALKLAEVDFITEKIGERPVLLLDDVFSELDEKHEEALMDIVNLQQSIITTTEPHEAISKTDAQVKYLKNAVDTL